MLLLRGGLVMRATALASGNSKAGKVLVITGPTGVGKSAVAIALAQRLSGEIISADSVQVYKGLDVGSAKTPLNERYNIPHHLIDILEPTDDYSVGDFFKDAREATDAVLARGRVPIVVGGTGLYLLWYMNGRPDTPAKPTEEQAAAVTAELASLSGEWDAAINHLAAAGDPETAQSLARNDWYRLRRALEILRITGKPRTAFALPWVAAEKQSSSEDASEVAVEREDFDFRCIFMHTRRTDLYPRLDLRCEQMLTDPQGLLQEASRLLDLGVLPNSSSPSRAIGYRQTMEYLVACRLAGGESSSKEFFSFLAGFLKASRNYAKRQITWFRDDDEFRWINASLPTADIVEFLENEYHKPRSSSQPSSWEQEEKAVMVKEVKILKTYGTENKVFRAVYDCANILAWIKQTQS